MMSVIHTQIINKDITLGSIGKETYVKTIVSNKEKNTQKYILLLSITSQNFRVFIDLYVEIQSYTLSSPIKN